jgi:hypothetical protein
MRTVAVQGLATPATAASRAASLRTPAAESVI